MQVWNMSQKAQIHALLTKVANEETIYINEYEEGLQYIMEEPNQQPKISMHTLMSTQAHKSSFTISVFIGNIVSTTLIDS